LICQGLSSKEIAAKLFLAKRTVDGYRANLLSKFGTNKSATMIRMVHEQQNSI
ncbi:MAG: DNA-binding response regulator, partial [Bacteroidetes bacterium]|nr:DNA-binding response regulator [Bacteroidota bacterium]